MGCVYKPVVIRRKDGQKVKSRSRFFWCRYVDPVDGKERRQRLSLPSGGPCTSRESAEATLRDLLRQRERTAAGLVDREVEAADIPIRKLAADHLRRKRHKTYRGRRLSRKHLGQTIHAVKWIGKAGLVRLADLQPEKIETALNALTRLGKAARTVNALRSRLYELCEHAVKMKLIGENPVKAVALAEGRKVKVRRALAPDEAARLLAAAESYSPTRATYYRLALTTGLRWGEIAALQWRDLRLDAANPSIVLRPETTKNMQGGRLPLRADVAERLAKLKSKTDRPGDRVFKTTPSIDVFWLDLARAGIERKTPDGRSVDRHALRTTFITWLSAAGVHPRVAMKMARHSDIRLTMGVYTDESALEDAPAVAALPDLDHADEPEAIPLRKAVGSENVSAEGVGLCVVPNNRERPGISLHDAIDNHDANRAESPVTVEHVCSNVHGAASVTLGEDERKKGRACLALRLVPTQPTHYWAWHVCN